MRRELMQGVVYGRKREPNSRRLGLTMELLSRHMAVAGLEQ